jgi:arylsulfatase A-like enzyme
LPNGQGFDHFFGHERGCIDNYSHFFYWKGPNKHDLQRNGQEVYYPGRNFGDLMVEEILEILDRKQDMPFFIFWAFNAPHYPYQGTTKWLDYYKDLPYPRRDYAAFVSSMDEKIGIVLDELDHLGLTDNTIVIFQSDQGHSCEERAHWGGGNAGPYRGCKFSFFEGGIRVPAMIRYPQVIPSDEVRDQVTSEMDWLPTIAELTGAEIAVNGIEGKSLLPVIEDPLEASQHKVLHWQQGDYTDESPWAVREGSWKLLGHPVDPSTGQIFADSDTLFLVNLKEDVSEKNNLAGRYPDQVQRLKSMHDEWLEKVKKEIFPEIIP